MWTLTLKNLLFPIFCKECGLRLLTDENGFFCATCWELPLRIERPFCSSCGRPLPKRVGMDEPDHYPCAACAARTDESPYRHVFGATTYEGAAAEAVKLLKFHERRWIVRVMCEELARVIETELIPERYAFIAPVPLHKVRLRHRGFNQAMLLADGIIDQFPNAEVFTGLQRIRPTKTQSRLNDPNDRKSNVRGAFAVNQDVDLTGKQVLLIDDVVTSGGTIHECARALQRAGAEAVDILSFALALPKKD